MITITVKSIPEGAEASALANSVEYVNQARTQSEAVFGIVAALFFAVPDQPVTIVCPNGGAAPYSSLWDLLGTENNPPEPRKVARKEEDLRKAASRVVRTEEWTAI
jgi:hypothetical protein